MDSETIINISDEKLRLDSYLATNPDSDSLAFFISNLSDDFQISLLDNWQFGNDVLYELLTKSSPKVISKIVNTFPISLSDDRVNLPWLISTAKYSVLEAQESYNLRGEKIDYLYIPTNLIDAKLAKYTFKSYDIFELRLLINDLEWCSNPELINDYIKHKEDEVISSANEDELASPFMDIFLSFKKMQNALFYRDENAYLYKEEYSLLSSAKNLRYLKLYDSIDKIFSEGNYDDVYAYLRKLSNRHLSNYIIDYHFEDCYYNVLIDIKELLRFQKNGHINLDPEHTKLYEEILNIDNLSINEKKSLHESLKNYNVKEMFYDDMSFARRIVTEAIKEESINHETLKQYRNEELSEQYGVNVYTIDDKPFFGLIKLGRNQSDLPEGHSYSLVGNDCTTVFGYYDYGDTYLYDSADLQPEQIVHVFPYDSYTSYSPFKKTVEPTVTVYTLMMPEEITGLAAEKYSEILILEKGSIETDIDHRIPELKRIALYCCDRNISDADIKKAKELGIGIVLVSAKDYFDKHDYYVEKFKDVTDSFNYKYFTDPNELDDYEQMR